MKKLRAIAALFLISVFLAGNASAATTSTVNPSVPAQNSPLSSSVLRSQFAAAANDINALWQAMVGSANQIMGSLASGQMVPLSVPACSTGLTWTNGVGFGCAAGSSGITGMTGDATSSGSGTATVTLVNSPTARTDIGLGTASTPTFAGLTLNGVAKLNLNSASLPAAQTGTVLQLGQANATTARLELDAFGGASHFSGIRSDGTNASPTTLQSGDAIVSLNSWGYNGTAIGGPTGAFQLSASQNWTSGAEGTQASIWTTPNGATSPVQVVTVGNDGGVTFGSPTGGDKGASTLNTAGTIWANGTQLQNGSFTAGLNMTITGTWPNLTFAASSSGTGVSPVIASQTPYTSDVAGNLFPLLYTGAGANASASEWTNGVVASLGSDVAYQLRFQMPHTLPATGTFTFRSVCLANASSGVVKYTVSDADVSGSANPSSASLTSETQTSITWSAADTYVTTDTTLTSTPSLDHVSVVAITFNHTGWTLAANLGCKFYELWK